MNLNLVAGLIDSVGSTLEARLDPQDEHCCVRLVSSAGGEE
jgi:hypothetical protein